MYIVKQYNILIFRDITKENVHTPYFKRFLYRFIFVTIKSNMTDCMNNLIKHYFFSLVFLGLCFMISCTDDDEMIRVSDSIRFISDVQNTWFSVGTRGTTEDTHPSASLLKTDGMNLLYLHTLYTDSIEPLSANNTIPSTRATPVNVGNMYETFGVSAYSYTGEWNGTQTPNYMYDVLVSKIGDSWMPSSSNYWPGSAYKMKFFAYAPKGNEAYRLSGREASGAPTITCTIPDDVTNQQDLLVAASDELPGNSNTSVALTFRHALTAVRFVCGSDMKAGTIKSVTLKEVNSTGTYNFGTHTWSGIGAVKDFSQTLGKASSGTPDEAITTEAQTFMMVPQTLPDGAVIEVVFNDGTEHTLTGNIGKQVWPMGKTVTYKISTTSVNWDYVLTVNGPADFTYAGETKTYRVTSYRQNSQGKKEPVKWKAQFSTDDGKTWSDARPDWLTAFTASGVGSTTAASLNATVGAQTGTTDSPHTRILREQRVGQGTEKAPYNLANGQGGPAIENTANCYVIDAPGYYSFPLVYGNAIKDGATNSSAYSSAAPSSPNILNPLINHAGAGITGPYLTDNGCVPAKAELVWQDAPSLVSEIKYNAGSNGGNISFKVDQNTIQQGNAVIAVKDASGDVLWSWHIWVTDEDVDNVIEVTNHQNVEYSFMPVPLGWCDGETVTYEARNCKVRFTAGEQTSDIVVSQKSSIVTIGGNHPYYQWGRKDPFRPSNGVNGNKIWYDANGTSSANNVKVESFSYGAECIRNYILKPDVMQKNKEGDNAYYNLWDADNNTYSTNDNQVVKTIYDPCPVGFKLPASNAFTGFTTTGSSSSTDYPANGTWDSTRNGWNFYAQANRTGQQIFFPASGTRNYIDGKVSLINSDGLYWSTGPYNQISGWRLNFRSSYVNPLGNYYRSAGYGLRPVQE